MSGTWNSGLGGMTLPNQTEYQGDYTISGQSVTFENAFGSQVCPGLQDIYNFNMPANSVEFVVIEDQCTSRRGHLRDTWTNADICRRRFIAAVVIGGDW